MPDLSEVLTEQATRLARPPAGGFADVERRARRARSRRQTAWAGAAIAAVSVAGGALAVSGGESLQVNQPAAEGELTSAPLRTCAPEASGVRGAGTLGPYGSGLAEVVLERLAGWRASDPGPQTGDFPGCAATTADRDARRAARYPLADYDGVVGAYVQLETAAGPSAVTIALTTGRYTPSLSRGDAEAISRAFLVQQAEEWQRMLASNPSSATGDPAAAAVATAAPDAEGTAPAGGHWWIYRGLQNKFGFAWTPDGSLTVARMDPDEQTPAAQEQLREALLAAAEFQSTH